MFLWCNRYLLYRSDVGMQAYSRMIMDTWEPYLDYHKPNLATSVTFQELTLGTVAPQFLGIVIRLFHLPCPLNVIIVCWIWSIRRRACFPWVLFSTHFLDPFVLSAVVPQSNMINMKGEGNAYIRTKRIDIFCARTFSIKVPRFQCQIEFWNSWIHTAYEINVSK